MTMKLIQDEDERVIVQHPWCEVEPVGGTHGVRGGTTDL